MSILSHNPNTYLNSYLSVTRTMIVTSSLSLGLLTYSIKTDLFDKYHVKYLSIFILFFAIVYGLKGGDDFKKYINNLEKILKDKKTSNREIYIAEISKWRKLIDLTEFYIFILVFAKIFIIYKIFFSNN